jgi:signal transduction histidine kinase
LQAVVKTFSKQERVHVHLKAFEGIERLEMSKRTVLFRITQEALANVARHAKASRVEVSIRKHLNAVRMEIKDDGRSFQVERTLHAKKNKRLGLLGMRERVEMVGGTFDIESAPGQGTTIRVEIPFAKAP